MATASLEERIAVVERELSELKQQLKTENTSSATPWWEKIAGTFADSEHYDAAMRLGREYRRSLRPKDAEQ